MDRKWILITGGSKGIGRALVTGLRENYNVVFTGRNEGAIHETQAQAAEGNTHHWVQGVSCDGNDESRVELLAQTFLAKWGAPEAIIHNAGVARDGLHIHQDAALWREVLETNVISLINWNRILLPAMLMQKRGSVVLMSSVSALKGNIGQTAYAASKAAMSGMARSLALEVARFGIRVNCIAPGLIRTEMLDDIPKEKLKQLRQSIPLRRLGETDDVLQTVAFLIGEGSQYMTGQTLVLDGGLSV
ncbi:SDR family NAD(P)-dependent oxidoreductase [Klebsiella sp. BIGb0407]|uniref:SDR family NAD(P)-dependent oxidoreductase n=1 Tax=Klebsiella sp. BIGb0407 TaxID=2940603 RepID=UPI0021675DC3|nr:SDR family oxidoreductase [Klebsiella sp. BIGb0407]MCS3430265.1 3-oxoacyl-[acyl-carrier protein] reductase [Klebsiella sp. BIGb0407]